MKVMSATDHIGQHLDKRGRLHRDDGPAIEWASGTKEWYLNDEPSTEEEIRDLMQQRAMQAFAENAIETALLVQRATVLSKDMVISAPRLNFKSTRGANPIPKRGISS